MNANHRSDAAIGEKFISIVNFVPTPCSEMLKQYCATVMTMSSFYPDENIVLCHCARRKIKKLAVIIKDHRRRIEQSHFVNGMDFYSLTCSLFSQFEKQFIK